MKVVPHICNPSYLEGRGQEDVSSKPARANSSPRPYLEKNPSQKRAGGVAQGEGTKFKPQYHTHTQKKVPIYTLTRIKAQIHFFFQPVSLLPLPSLPSTHEN
jgi:hypothetical protein